MDKDTDLGDGSEDKDTRNHPSNQTRWEYKDTPTCNHPGISAHYLSITGESRGNKTVVIHVLVINNLNTEIYKHMIIAPFVTICGTQTRPGRVIPGGWTVMYRGFKQDTGWEGCK